MPERRFAVIKRELVRDYEAVSSYDSLESEYALICELIRKRLEAGLTQSELAQRIGTRQSAISRLESGEANPTIGFIHKVAHALRVEITIVIK